MTDAAGFVITLGAMVGFATVIGIYDLLAERQYRRRRDQHRRSA